MTHVKATKSKIYISLVHQKLLIFPILIYVQAWWGKVSNNVHTSQHAPKIRAGCAAIVHLEHD